MTVSDLPRVEPDLQSMVAAGMSDPAIARALGVSSRTVLRRRIRLGLPSKWQPELAPHGTRAAYHRGCRCDPCKAANAAAQREYVEQLAGRVPTTDRARRPWTAEEDAVLLAGDGTLAQRAMRLGRTYAAAKRRLDRLHVQPP